MTELLNGTPLMYAINGFIYPISAYILVFLAFWGSERIKRKYIILIMCAYHAVFVAVGFYLIAAHLTDNIIDRSALNNQFVLVFNMTLVIGFITCFKVNLAKGVYILSTAVLLVTFMNSLSSFIADWLFPDIVDVWTSWQNAVSILLVHSLLMPFFCYFLKKYMKSAILDLPNKSIALLCTTPILFILLTWGIQFTADGIVQQFAAWFLVNAVSIIVVFVNVLMTLNVAKATRLTIEADAREQAVAAENVALERLNRIKTGHLVSVMQNAETVKAMHHDLRHHLTVIGQLADNKNTGKIKEYIEGLTDEISMAAEQQYCSNQAVNAVAAHYLSLASGDGIIVDARLRIPEDTGCVPAMDLCVILGNFLENALEACRRMEYGERFIRVHSVVDDESISIVVSNSFDGIYEEKDGIYFSRKSENKPREGVGMSSVKAVCEKHGGLMLVDICGDVWKSSALVNVK